MNILNLLVNILPHFDFFLDLRKVVFAYNPFNKVIGHLSSSHVEVWNDNLAYEYSLICLQLINCFKLLLKRFNFSVDFSFTHRWFTRYFAYNRLKQSRHHSFLPWLFSSAHVIKAWFCVFLSLFIQFENLLLHWVMLFASRILHWNNAFLNWKQSAKVLEEIIVRLLYLFKAFIWLSFAARFNWFPKIKNINLIFFFDFVCLISSILAKLIKESAAFVILLVTVFIKNNIFLYIHLFA